MLFDFDRGVHRAPNRLEEGNDVVQVALDVPPDLADDYMTLQECEALRESDLADYQTAVIDTVGTCLEFMIRDTIRNDPKMGRGGAPTLQCYGVLKSRFERWLEFLRSCRLHVILVAHTAEVQRGDDLLERLQAPGGSKDTIQTVSDIAGRLFIDNAGQRRLDFNPTALSLGKNVHLPTYDVPHTAEAPDLLGGILTQALQNINDGIMGHDEETRRLTDLRRTLEGYTEPAQISDLFAKMVSTDAARVDMAMVGREAKRRGYFPDTGSRRWFRDENEAMEWHRAEVARKTQEAQPPAADKPAPPSDPPANKAQPAEQDRTETLGAAAAKQELAAQGNAATPTPAEPATNGATTAPAARQATASEQAATAAAPAAPAPEQAAAPAAGTEQPQNLAADLFFGGEGPQ